MISISRYKIIADLINNAQARGADMVSNIDQMAIDLGNSEILSTDNDRQRLENQITATSGLLSSRHVLYTPQMLKFVRALQKYVNDDYPLVNNFLSDNSTQVKQTFADISETVGYYIDRGNIEGNIS